MPSALPRFVTSMMSATVAIAAVAEPPAIPLITHDPYVSVWSMSRALTDDWPRHWSGATMGMCGMVRINGNAYRWCGTAPSEVPAAEQIGVEVGQTSTRYAFRADGVEFAITFCTPLGTTDSSATAPAASIISLSTDAVVMDWYVDVSGEWCTNAPETHVSWSRHESSDLHLISMASVEQPVLRSAGDRRRIDWGRIFLAAEQNAMVTLAVGGHLSSRGGFAAAGHAAFPDDLRMPRAVSDDWPVLSATGRAARSSKEPRGFSHVYLAFDEGRAIELFERPLRPYWKAQDSTDVVAAIEPIRKRLQDAGRSEIHGLFDDSLRTDALRVGGERYADLLTLAYRQVLAGHRLVRDWDGTPLMFSKENTSNGCIATVDVIYPACPFFLYHNPELLKAQLRPLLMYAASPRWTFPFAPHDLGTYPKANGQIYGGGESSEVNQMPVEESGNMLIMLAALARVEGNAEFSKPYLSLLERWAVYLKDYGLDPANQLCTDDFAGHLARNANLSAKTCIALGAYARLLEAIGASDESQQWRQVAEDFSRRWIVLARGRPATVLAFGGDAESWSQKYNLIWDRVLGLGLFDQDIMNSEMAWYRTRLQKFGLPLDSRRTYTKLDWTTWSACLTGRREDFDAIMKPVLEWAFASQPPSRVPLSDWYETTDGTTMGMHTRTVVGGLWMPLLLEKVGEGFD